MHINLMNIDNIDLDFFTLYMKIQDRALTMLKFYNKEIDKILIYTPFSNIYQRERNLSYMEGIIEDIGKELDKLSRHKGIIAYIALSGSDDILEHYRWFNNTIDKYITAIHNKMKIISKMNLLLNLI